MEVDSQPRLALDYTGSTRRHHTTPNSYVMYDWECLRERPTRDTEGALRVMTGTARSDAPVEKVDVGTEPR